MDWNRITGTISTELGKLSSLEYLFLNRNQLDGIIPSQLSHLPNLSMLMVDNNKLVGELDACNVEYLTSDCGNPQLGCPDCQSDSKEVECPCCTTCCYDGDEHCNLDDWLSQILEDWKDNDEGRDEGDGAYFGKDSFVPAN